MPKSLPTARSFNSSAKMFSTVRPLLLRCLRSVRSNRCLYRRPLRTNRSNTSTMVPYMPTVVCTAECPTTVSWRPFDQATPKAARRRRSEGCRPTLRRHLQCLPAIPNFGRLPVVPILLVDICISSHHPRRRTAWSINSGLPIMNHFTTTNRSIQGPIRPRGWTSTPSTECRPDRSQTCTSP